MVDVESIALEENTKQAGTSATGRGEEAPEKEKPKETESEKENDPEKPDPKDFNIPESEEDHAVMVEGMIKCGMFPHDAEANIKSRTTAFNKAIRQYERGKNQQNPGTRMTTRGKNTGRLH